MEISAASDGSWRSMLAARPIRNSAASVDDAPGGEVTIRIKRDSPWWMIAPVSWIVPMRNEREIILDRVGALIWRLCDGGRTVENIVDAFGERHGLTFHEARASVTGYMKELIQRGALAVAVDGSGEVR